MAAGPTGDRRGRRLRDLETPERLIAALVGLLLVLPIAVSAGRAVADDWVPSGDEAVIAVRVHDVLSTDPPLTGLPSTSDLYGTGIRTMHPGPIEFYLLALPVRLLGPQLGLLLGAGAFVAASLLISAWVVLRRAGPGVALWASVLLMWTTWSTGTAVLTDPISSNVGGYPLLAAAVLAWALLLGDLRLLPLAVGVISFVAQQHLAMVIPAGAVTAVASVGVARELRQRWSEREDRARALRWVGGAVLVAGVLWLPVAIDQVTGDPGNLTAIARFSGDEGRASLENQDAIDAVLRVAGPPPLQLSRDVTGYDLTRDLGAAEVVGGVAALAGLVALAVLGWRRDRALAALGPVGLALAAAGFLATTSVPDSLEAGRINLYRWSWALAFVVWWAAGWSVARALVRWAPGVVPAARRAAPVLGVGVIVAVLVASLATTGPDDARRDAQAFDVDRQLGDTVDDRFGDRGPVMVVDDGTAANLSTAPALIARLVDEGTSVQLPPRRIDSYGSDREFDPETVGSVLLVASRFGALDGVAGQPVEEYQLTPDTAPVVDRLVEAARSAPVRRSAEADDLLAEIYPPVGALADRLVENLATNPSEALTSPTVLQLLLDGYLDAPTFDRGDLQAMLDAVPEQRTLWTDDRVAVYELTLDDLRAFRPEFFDGP
jgi:hypothetical protein